MRRKKKTSLPRLTVLSMNRRELVSFVNAVELLSLKVQELALIVQRVELLEATLTARSKKSRKASPVASENGSPEPERTF